MTEGAMTPSGGRARDGQRRGAKGELVTLLGRGRRWAIALVVGVLVVSAAFGLRAQTAQALENGVARTPPMGWNTWNTFGCNINETLIRQTADAMVANGMRDAGYKYVVVDDCWFNPDRDAQGNLQ